MNALKHGLRAEALALPNENAEELSQLTDEWLDYYQPASPGMRALLDTAVHATVQQRRCRRFACASKAAPYVSVRAGSVRAKSSTTVFPPLNVGSGSPGSSARAASDWSARLVASSTATRGRSRPTIARTVRPVPLANQPVRSG